MKQCCSEELSRGEAPLYGAIRQCRECGETWVYRRKMGWRAEHSQKGGSWKATVELVLRDGQGVTEWERGFLNDILAKLGAGERLSKKQAAKLRDISAKRCQVKA